MPSLRRTKRGQSAGSIFLEAVTLSIGSRVSEIAFTVVADNIHLLLVELNRLAAVKRHVRKVTSHGCLSD